MSENIFVEEILRITNIVSADIEINDSGELTIIGIVNGNITIRSNGTALIYGVLQGNITNSGLCKIFGIVNGQLIDNGGEYEIDKNALILKPK